MKVTVEPGKALQTLSLTERTEISSTRLQEFTGYLFRKTKQRVSRKKGKAQIMRGKIISLILALILLRCTDRPATERVLFDFETEQDLDRVHWKCHALFSLSEEHATHGSRCLRLELYPSPYPGVAPMLRENDWSEFRNLCFAIYNP